MRGQTARARQDARPHEGARCAVERVAREGGGMQPSERGVGGGGSHTGAAMQQKKGARSRAR